MDNFYNKNALLNDTREDVSKTQVASKDTYYRNKSNFDKLMFQ